MVCSCPEEENYAAIAKQLHDTALCAEQRIYEAEQLLRSAVNPPTLINTSTSPQSGILAGSDQVISPSSTTTFVNFPLNGSSDTVYQDQDPYILLGEGIYEAGFSGVVTPVGAVFAFSHRTFKIQQLRPAPEETLDPVIYTVGYTTYEPNVGIGMDFSVSALFRIKPGDTLQFVVNHGNSSDLELATGAIFWMQKMSTVDITRVL